MSGVVRGVVPPAWTAMIAQYRRAQVARDGMRDAQATRQVRDTATADYARSVDAMMDQMARLSEDHTLGQITLLLSKKDRS